MVTLAYSYVLFKNKRTAGKDELYYIYAVEPLNKGHFGDDINLALLGGSRCMETIGNGSFRTSSSVLCREV